MTPQVHVLARLPIAGQTKTRLIPTLGAQGAAGLARRQLMETLNIAIAARLGRVYLWLTPGCWHPAVRRYARIQNVALKCQPPGDLGARLLHIAQSSRPRRELPIFIGTDCRDLRAEDISCAAKHLTDGSDAVIGPAEDGGYYLLGLKHWRAALFQAIPWGSEEVLTHTVKRLRQAQSRYHMLEKRLDIDRPADLRGASPHRLAAGAVGRSN